MSSSPASASTSSATLVEMYGCIVDYACCHRLLDVIHEVGRRHRDGLSSLAVPHVRLASAGLYKMVVTDNVAEYSTALLLAEQLFQTLGSFENHSLVRCYAKLLCGLKVKNLFHCLQSSPHQTLTLLRKYFPRGGSSFDKELALRVPPLAKKLQTAVSDFRKCFLPLVGHECKREKFMRTQYEKLYGNYFSRCLARHAASFLTELEKDLPDTFIDELLKTGSEDMPTNTPTLSSDVMLEMLLDCVQGKATLQSTDLLGLVKDLSPEASPDLQGFQHSIIHMSSDGESISSGHTDSGEHDSSVLFDDCPPTNIQHTYDADAKFKSSGHGKFNDAGSRLRNEEGMDISSDSEGSRSNVDDLPDIHKGAHCQGAKGQKRQRKTCNLESKKRKVAHQSKRNPRSALNSKQDTCMLPTCHVKLCYQKNLQTWDSSGIKHRVFT